MTGTAKTEEEEFESIYKLRTIVIPTHRPMIRADKPDAIYRTVSAKFKAVAKIAAEKHAKGQPVLIGTTSIEKSEVMSMLLQDMRIPHEVLNAKQHEKEADIVANAGQRSTITIATNMAGRGTDIKLGEGVAELGGLAILGTERHEARRIDNQLRGRSGRQGDPGESQFFVSMEDDLMRLFGGDRLKAMMERLKVPDDVPLENGMVSRSIESAQKKVEGRNFDTRRHVLQYDDVMNKHRDIIYKRRQKILEKIAESEKAISDQRSAASDENLRGPLHEEIVAGMRKEAESLVGSYSQATDPDDWEWEKLHEAIAAVCAPVAMELTMENLKTFQDKEALTEHVAQAFAEYYEKKCDAEDAATVNRAEQVVTLRSIDAHWMDHIDDMSHLREQVAFAGYAQRDPLIEYQDQGFRRFHQLISTINATIVRTLLNANVADFTPRFVVQMTEEDVEEAASLRTNREQIEGELESTGVVPIGAISDQRSAISDQSSMQEAAALLGFASQQKVPVAAGRPVAKPAVLPKVGRNDPCPCGSGKKYKKCHGKDE